MLRNQICSSALGIHLRLLLTVCCLSMHSTLRLHFDFDSLSPKWGRHFFFTSLAAPRVILRPGILQFGKVMALGRYIKIMRSGHNMQYALWTQTTNEFKICWDFYVNTVAANKIIRHLLNHAECQAACQAAINKWTWLGTMGLHG